MSLEIVLLPLAFAVVTATQAVAARREERAAFEAMAREAVGASAEGQNLAPTRPALPVRTRMKDDHLLSLALEAVSASVDRTDGRIIGRWQGVEVEFVRDHQGILQANFTGEIDFARGAEIIAAVDAAYGRQVQEAVIARLRNRAVDSDMTVVSESRDLDDAVTIVLEAGVGR